MRFGRSIDILTPLDPLTVHLCCPGEKGGKLEGKGVDYYKSGKVKWEVNYVDGKLEGKEVWYYESGKVETEGNYVDGKQEGKWVGYYENGKVKGKRNFTEGNGK